MDFCLSKKHKMARELFKQFAEEQVKLFAQEMDGTEKFSRETVEKMAKYGFLGIPVPKELGGCGVGSPENFKLLEDLAEVVGGTVSCSRAVVDSGWKPKDLQVGQPGKTVRLLVYFAIGIYGAIQHVAGMEEPEVIVAINKDEDVPIFDVADYGLVGDLNKIVPRLTEEIKKAIANK